MNDELDDIKNTWHAAKSSSVPPHGDPGQLIMKAEKKRKGSLRQHMGTIAVLCITLIGLAWFFLYVARFQQFVSHIGVGLMVGGLVVRIVIELYSIYLSGKIDMSAAALNTTHSAVAFYKFRKKINGPVTVTILILYTIGFYMLTPEFSLYFSTLFMILIDASYVLGALIFTWSIRTSIRKEMGILDDLLKLQQDISGAG
jgi:hypothetical protein